VHTYTARLEREKRRALVRRARRGATGHTWARPSTKPSPHARSRRTVVPDRRGPNRASSQATAAKGHRQTVEQARKHDSKPAPPTGSLVEQTRKAAAALTNRGISMRDAAAILGHLRTSGSPAAHDRHAATAAKPADTTVGSPNQASEHGRHGPSALRFSAFDASEFMNPRLFSEPGPERVRRPGADEEQKTRRTT